MADRSLLRVESMSVSFGDDPAVVQSLNYSLPSGETLGIVGESGSGKSMSCHALVGLLPAGASATGEAWLGDTELLGATEKTLRGVRGREIAMVFQHPMLALNPFLSIGEQIAEPLRLHQNVSRQQAKKRALALLDEVGIDDGPRRFGHYPHEFSGGMCQRVMIAMALITEPKLLIADEPTSALDVQVQAQILELIKRIQQQRNIGVLLISHDLEVIRRAADRVLVMRKGELVEQGDVESVLSSPQNGYTRDLIDAVPTTPKPEIYRSDRDRRDTLLEVHNLDKWFGPRDDVAGYHALRDISLSVRSGEVLGIVGESGSGKTTLSRAIVRLLAVDNGQITLAGTPLQGLSTAALRPLRRQMQMVFQDPYGSLNPRMTVQQIIAESLLLHRIAKDRQAAWSRVESLLGEVGLDPAMAKRYPHQFSGGQRQRIAIARALACEPRLLIADEIVSALDVTVQARILELLLKLVRERDLTVIFISHDLAVVRYVADRVAVMKEGVLVEVGDTESLMSAPTHAYTRALVGLVNA